MRKAFKKNGIIDRTTKAVDKGADQIARDIHHAIIPPSTNKAPSATVANNATQAPPKEVPVVSPTTSVKPIEQITINNNNEVQKPQDKGIAGEKEILDLKIQLAKLEQQNAILKMSQVDKETPIAETAKANPVTNTGSNNNSIDLKETKTPTPKSGYEYSPKEIAILLLNGGRFIDYEKHINEFDEEAKTQLIENVIEAPQIVALILGDTPDMV